MVFVFTSNPDLAQEGIRYGVVALTSGSVLVIYEKRRPNGEFAVVRQELWKFDLDRGEAAIAPPNTEFPVAVFRGAYRHEKNGKLFVVLNGFPKAWEEAQAKHGRIYYNTGEMGLLLGAVEPDAVFRVSRTDWNTDAVVKYLYKSEEV